MAPAAAADAAFVCVTRATAVFSFSPQRDGDNRAAAADDVRTDGGDAKRRAGEAVGRVDDEPQRVQIKTPTAARGDDDELLDGRHFFQHWGLGSSAPDVAVPVVTV